MVRIHVRALEIYSPKCYTNIMDKKYEDVEKRLSKKAIIWRNFIGGFSWGIGSALGAALLVTVLGLFLAKINFVKMVGNFVASVNTVVEQKNH